LSFLEIDERGKIVREMEREKRSSFETKYATFDDIIEINFD